MPKPDQPKPGSRPAGLFAARLDPRWSAQWIRRTLTDEPAKGMGSPFSETDAQLFLRACGLAPSEANGASKDDPAINERMLAWLQAASGK